VRRVDNEDIPAYINTLFLLYIYRERERERCLHIHTYRYACQYLTCINIPFLLRRVDDGSGETDRGRWQPPPELLL